MFKRIDHVEIVTAQFERSLSFYTEILGFTVKQRMKVAFAPLREIVYLALGDTVLELMDVADAAPASEHPWQHGYRMMALEVEHMERALEYLAENGVPVTWGPVNLGNAKRAEIMDPDGLPIELRQW